MTSPLPFDARSDDRWAIHNLICRYANSVDQKDWATFESLFIPAAHIDYLSAGGIAGSPAEVAAWMPEAMGFFAWTLHSVSNHLIEFTGETTAVGTLHLLARHGISFEGTDQFMDVGATYADDYVLTNDGWRFGARTEHTKYITGGQFADLARSASPIAFTG